MLIIHSVIVCWLFACANCIDNRFQWRMNMYHVQLVHAYTIIWEKLKEITTTGIEWQYKQQIIEVKI